MLRSSSPPRRHLALLGPSLAGGGAERTLLHLTMGYAEQGHQIDLLLCRATGQYLDKVPPGVNIVDMAAKRVAACLPALARYLRRQRPDGLIAVTSDVALIALMARRLARVDVPIVARQQITPRCYSLHTYPFRWRARLMRPLMRWLYPKATSVVGVSKGTARDTEEFAQLAAGSARVVYSPIIRPGLDQLAQQSVEHPWLQPAADIPVIVSAGRLHPQKDFSTLLRAFARVRQQRPARLLILGQGPERATLEQLRSELGLDADVDLPGFVDNPYAHLAKASLFVLSSRWEGLPTVLVEALFCGLPVVATDGAGDGAREVLQDGEWGRLVPVGDIEALAAAMLGGLEGNLPTPSAATWQPFTLQAALDGYLQALALVP